MRGRLKLERGRYELALYSAWQGERFAREDKLRPFKKYLGDGHADVSVTGATIASGLAGGTYVALGYEDAERLGGAVTYLTFNNDIDARISPDHLGRHYLGYATIPATGEPPASGGGATPPGGGGGRNPNTQIP